jgi:response regulator RpfG family c-di-GMP phosphodiesterase
VNSFLFANETLDEPETQKKHTDFWDILVVDDEEDIHQVTKLVLSNFKFEEKKLRFHHAYSAKQAIEILQSEDKISVGLIDVVMESNHAGLDLIKYIRNDIANHGIRLILRTGQPGEAPEESVIRDYDINDYKNKTELTAVKLKTLLYSALRSHRDIQTIERHKLGLERIINASSSFLRCDSVRDFASTILSHVSDVLGLKDNDIYCAAAVNEKTETETKFKLLAASGEGVEPHSDVIPKNVKNLLIESHTLRTSHKTHQEYIGYFPSRCGGETMLYVSKEPSLQASDYQLLEFFSNNIALAYDNLKLRETIKESQKELLYILGEAVEKRSKETGSHVRRVAHYSMLLAQLYGLSDYESEIIKLASPLHDIGKISIPDSILNKPAKLTADEWLIMQTHAEIGYEILQNSTNEILQCGATIAHQHHEKWDGSGYPQGLTGENINIVGRITALADVFDALGSDRCYKKAWPFEKVIALIQSEKAKQFDPKLVDLFMQNIDQFIAIRDRYPD